MTLKVIIWNGQPKRILPTVERIEAVTISVQALVTSTQRSAVTSTIRPTRTASIRLAPHFTCSAESCYESENAIKLRIKRRKLGVLKSNCVNSEILKRVYNTVCEI